MFQHMNETNAPAFALATRLLFAPARIGRYLCCILIGLPCWYVIGLVILFSPEFAQGARRHRPHRSRPSPSRFGYAGICVGEPPQRPPQPVPARPQNRPAHLHLGRTFALTNVFFFLHSPSPATRLHLSSSSASRVGYWAIFVTVAAEHFGTNMRATVATTVPNFSRGAVIPITMLFTWLKPQLGILHSGLAVGWIVTAIAFAGWFGLRETFHDDLDYLEA